jgi:broad specificity phosphatase PhoE
MTLQQIYLIRHGETAWNVDGRWQGQLDVPLSERGIQQAKALGTYLHGRPLTHVYTSDLKRAHVTAELIAQAIGAQVVTDVRLREMHLGVLQGLTKPEIESRYPHELTGMHDNWLDHQVEQGESRRMVQTRAIAVLDEAALHHPTKEVALVAHGGVIRAMMQRLFGAVFEAMHKPIENTSLTTLALKSGKWEIVAFAETPHLAPHVSPTQPGEAQ